MKNSKKNNIIGQIRNIYNTLQGSIDQNISVPGSNLLKKTIPPKQWYESFPGILIKDNA